MINIKKKINYTLFIYFLYLFFVSISTYIFLNQFILEFNIADKNNNIILKNITFGHGPLIHNLFYIYILRFYTLHNMFYNLNHTSVMRFIF